MKKALYATAGSALALVLLAHSLPASADVSVLVNVNKTKDTTVTERITITKTVDIQVAATSTEGTAVILVPVNFFYHAAAEADAIVNQTSTRNDVDSSLEQLDPGVDLSLVNDFGIQLHATMTGSITGNQGIVDVNQDVGNMSNQGNQVVLAVATPSTATSTTDSTAQVLVNAQSEAQQTNTNNAVWHGEDPNADQQTFFDQGSPNELASITDSINDNVGIVNVNQNAGNMNNQANSVALAVAISAAGFALSEAALGQENSNPDHETNGFTGVFEFGVNKQATMDGSLNGNTGVGGVNQAAGNMANQANIFSTAFIDGGGAVGLGQ